MPRRPDQLDAETPPPRRIAAAAGVLLALAAALPLLGPLDAAVTGRLEPIHGCTPMAFFQTVGEYTRLLAALLVVTVVSIIATVIFAALLSAGIRYMSLAAVRANQRQSSVAARVAGAPHRRYRLPPAAGYPTCPAGMAELPVDWRRSIEPRTAPSLPTKGAWVML